MVFLTHILHTLQGQLWPASQLDWINWWDPRFRISETDSPARTISLPSNPGKDDMRLGWRDMAGQSVEYQLYYIITLCEIWEYFQADVRAAARRLCEQGGGRGGNCSAWLLLALSATLGCPPSHSAPTHAVDCVSYEQWGIRIIFSLWILFINLLQKKKNANYTKPVHDEVIICIVEHSNTFKKKIKVNHCCHQPSPPML